MLSALPWSGPAAAPKQQAVDQWRSLTLPGARPPRVFVKGDHIHFYFQSETNAAEFHANWSRLRVPTTGYKINSALLRLMRRPSRMADDRRGWAEATVIAGAEWHRLSTNLISVLTPQSAGHGIYYQGFLSDRLWYRDAHGTARFASMGEQPHQVVIDHRLSMEETMQALATHVEAKLARDHPGDTLFLLLAPNAHRFPQPLLLDLKQRQCVWLSPAALTDPTERGVGLAGTARGLGALLLEGHGVALMKNPVSSMARLADLVVQTFGRVLRLPLPKRLRHPAQPSGKPGMDLAQWEAWLDRYTGTQRQAGTLDLLIGGERFFPRLRQAIVEATNHIHFEVYVFDRDDVGVAVADQLKRRSRELEVKVLLDQMGTLGSGMAPPSTPLPEDFVWPTSIISYLRRDSAVQVRQFLNPWFSSDHSKVYLVDGTRAWVGGMNLGREYRYEWHDLMVELGGPVVGSLEDEFRRAWAHEGPLGDLAYVAARLAGPRAPQWTAPPPDAIPVRLLPTKTAWKPFNAAVQGALTQARSYIYLEHPYLFDKRTIGRLVQARNRGVDVRVILPRVNDFKAGGRGNLVLANYLRAHGVRVFFYPGMTHVKALLVDDWACLGSSNLNHLSLRLCQEHNVATSDPAFAARVKGELFAEDFARSYELLEPLSLEWMDLLADVVLEGF